MMRSGRLRKALVLLLALVVVGGALFGCARYYLTSRHASKQIEDKLQAVLGVPVEIDDADVGIKSGSSLGGVKVYEANGHRPKEPWLKVKSVQTDLSALDVVGGDGLPKRVTLSGAEINLRFDEDGHLLTGLPSMKATGQAMPRLVIENGKLTLEQADHPKMVIEGLNAEAGDHDGDLSFTGTINDPYWGEWAVAASFKTAGKIELRLKTPHTHITQEKLERLPFVPASVWRQVQLDGISPVDFDVQYTPGDKSVDYRVDLAPENTEVTVTSIQLHASKASGKVTVKNRFVELRDVRGRDPLGTPFWDLLGGSGGSLGREAQVITAANSTIELPKADLDFRTKAYDLTFEPIAVAGVDVRLLPKLWKIRDLPFVEGPVILEGKVNKLNVHIAKGEVQTTGEGKGTVETIVFKKPTQADVRLIADETGFHFSTTPKSALNMLKSLVPPIAPMEDSQENAPDEVRNGPHPLAVPAKQGTDALQSGTGAVLKGGTQAMDQVNRWMKAIPGRKTEYLEASLALKDVDVEEVFRGLNVIPPFPISGMVTFQVQVAVPINTPNDTRAYKMNGSVKSGRLNIAGLELAQVTAKVNYDDGVLTLDELHGGFPDTGGTFDGGGKLHYAPSGDMTLNLRIERASLNRALALLPSAESKGDGMLSGQIDARVPFNRVRDPQAWEAAGVLHSDRIAAYGLVLSNARLALTVKNGTAMAHDLDGELEGGRVSGTAEVSWAEGYPYKGKIELKDADLAALQRLAPNLRPALPVEGRAGFFADFQGKLTPLSFTASGTARAQELTVGDVHVEALAFKWAQEADRVKLSDLSAKLYGGEVSGSATVPLAETVAGDATLKIDVVDALKLAKAVSVVPVKIEGRISGTVTGSLSAAAPNKPRELTTQIDLTAPTLRVQGVAAEKLRGNVVYRGGAADYQLEGDALGGRFELKGKLPPRPEPPDKEPQGRLRIQGVHLSRLGAALNLRDELAPLSGKVEVDMAYRHEGPDRKPVGSGRFVIRNVRWADNEVAESILGDVRLNGTEVQLRNVSGNLGEGSLRGSLVLNFKEMERSWFHIQVERVEAATLLLPFTSSLAPSPTSQPVGVNAAPIQGPLEIDLRGQLGSQWHVTGNVALSRGKIYGVEVGEWRLPVSLSYAPGQGTGQIEFSDNNMQLAQGRVQGRASLRWGDGVRLEGALRFFDVDLPTLLHSTGGASKVTGGRASGRLDFGGDNLRSADDLTATLDASFTQAQALQLPVLDVLARYVAPGQSAMTFQKGDLRATLARGVVRVKRLSLSNATLQILLEGTMTLAGRLDLDATASTGNLGGINTNALRLLGLRLPPIGPIPVATLVQATAFLSNRVVHLRVTGTIKNPNVQVDPVKLLTEEAVRFFLGEALGAPGL